MRRVAITGIGVVTPLGHSAAEVFAAARDGHSAIRSIELPFGERRIDALAARVAFEGAEHFEPAKLRLLDRAAQFAIVAAQRALEDARLEADAGRRAAGGVFVGTGMGGSQTLDDGYRSLYGERSDRIRPQTVLMGMYNAAAAWIASEHGLRGPALTYSTACSSAAVALGEAWLRIARGELDLALAGGTDAPLATGSMMAWAALRALASTDPEQASASCKPFAKNRSGMVLAEGAAILTLEPWDLANARGAPIHGELLGYGLVTDVAHLARPSLAGQADAMRAALRCAGIDASQIDAINAHGTGTQANDGVETAAIKDVFGGRAQHIPISATKALHGHLLGAAGALECVLALSSMREGVALPTMHLHCADPECDLDYVANCARGGLDLRTMLSNSFAFGGTNAVLTLRRAPDSG